MKDTKFTTALKPVGESTQVEVAVRVRPFNKKERESNETCVVEMTGQRTLLHHPDKPDDEYAGGLSTPRPLGSATAPPTRLSHLVPRHLLTIALAGSSHEPPPPSHARRPRKFDFDKSYWSHDGFFEDENKINVGESDRYASQQTLRNGMQRHMTASNDM